MVLNKHFVIGLLAVVPSLNCFGDEATRFPPGLKPLNRVIMVEPPAVEGHIQYPERFNSIYGQADDYNWGHMNGYIHAPIEAVWAAVKDPEVIADRRYAASLSYEFDSQPEYDHSFILHYSVDALIDVEWDEAWRFGVLKGSNEAPELIANTSQKVSGTTFIDLVQGSMTLEKITDRITRFDYMQHLEAARTDTDTIALYFEDLFTSVVARANNRSLPEY